MVTFVLDRGKILLSLSVILSFVAQVTTNVTCTITRNGAMRTMQCAEKCCGPQGDQECCEEPEPDDDDGNLGIIIGASVAGGVAVICLVIVVILCCLKKNNVKQVKIHGDNGGHGSRDIASPPPPYNPVNVFVTDNARQQQTSFMGPPARGAQGVTSGSNQGSLPAQPVPPPYSYEAANSDNDTPHPLPEKIRPRDFRN